MRTGTGGLIQGRGLSQGLVTRQNYEAIRRLAFGTPRKSAAYLLASEALLLLDMVWVDAALATVQQGKDWSPHLLEARPPRMSWPSSSAVTMSAVSLGCTHAAHSAQIGSRVLGNTACRLCLVLAAMLTSSCSTSAPHAPWPGRADRPQS